KREEECTTPKNHEYRIPAALVCPPPPRKKHERPTRRAEPRNRFFQSPELDKFLSGAAQSRGN
ncbi:hypothetical protein PHJA_001296400, partial [Phtheirospermum japonicum]